MEDHKKDLFFYFVLTIKEAYTFNSNKVLKFNRKYIQKMLFLSAINSVEFLEMFNNFYSMYNGPVEADCLNFIEQEGDFEKLLESNELLLKKIKGEISNDEKKIIKIAVIKIRPSYFSKDIGFLEDITKTYYSYKLSWEKCLIYSKKAYPISKKEIEIDGTTDSKVIGKALHSRIKL